MKNKYENITDEFDINNSEIQSHFTLIKSHSSGRRAYLRTELKTGDNSIEVISPVTKYSCGKFYSVYPDPDDFLTHGAYISGDDIFRDEKMDYYLENGFAVSYSQYLRNNRS